MQTWAEFLCKSMHDDLVPPVRPSRKPGGALVPSSDAYVRSIGT